MKCSAIADGEIKDKTKNKNSKWNVMRFFYKLSDVVYAYGRSENALAEV